MNLVLRRRWPAVIAAAAVAVAVLFTAWLVRATAVSTFPHRPHREAGLSCEICHASVRVETFAGRPTAETCRMCHEDGRTWKVLPEPVVRVPDHVFFSHRRHVGVGRIGCPICHGDVGSSDRIASGPPVPVRMTFCVNCHETAGVSTDCIACHK